MSSSFTQRTNSQREVATKFYNRKKKKDFPKNGSKSTEAKPMPFSLGIDHAH
jgi:hypothetical protein